jgi:dTDP-4-amino-4,6-dideoxygalactose transaminase
MKFNYFKEWVARRRQIARLYDTGLAGIEGLVSHPRSGKDYFDVYQNYVIRAKRRDELVQHLRGCGIEVLISWPVPLHKQKALGLGQFSLPLTERIANEVISLPMYPELTDEEVNIVIAAVRKFFQN